MPDPLVGVIMGSDSDWPVMRAAAEALAEFDVPLRGGRVLRAPHPAADARLRRAPRPGAGLRVVIAGAGGAAHLPGMVAAATPLPVIGVPVPLGQLDGLDSLLSIVQMPAGVPVATVAVGGARNAGLLAVRILAAGDPALLDRMVQFQAELERSVLAKDAALRAARPPSGSRPAGRRNSVAGPPASGRTVAVHGRGGGPALNSYRTREVAVR